MGIKNQSTVFCILNIQESQERFRIAIFLATKEQEKARKKKEPMKFEE